MPRGGISTVRIRVMAAVLVPLLALAPSCTALNREVRLERDDGPPVVFIAEGGGYPIEIPEAELWESFRTAVRHMAVKPDPLVAAEEVFGLVEGSGTPTATTPAPVSCREGRPVPS